MCDTIVQLNNACKWPCTTTGSWLLSQFVSWLSELTKLLRKIYCSFDPRVMLLHVVFLCANIYRSGVELSITSQATSVCIRYNQVNLQFCMFGGRKNAIEKWSLFWSSVSFNAKQLLRKTTAREPSRANFRHAFARESCLGPFHLLQPSNKWRSYLTTICCTCYVRYYQIIYSSPPPSDTIINPHLTFHVFKINFAFVGSHVSPSACMTSFL